MGLLWNSGILKLVLKYKASAYMTSYNESMTSQTYSITGTGDAMSNATNNNNCEVRYTAL